MTSRDDLPSHVSIAFRDGSFHAVCLRCGAFLGSNADIRLLQLAEENHNCVHALTIHQTGTGTVVRCTGRITSQMTPALKGTVKPLIANGNTVVLDLSDVTYMDSSGLGAIVGLYASAKVAGCQFKLINLNQRLKELFRVTRLFELLTGERAPNLRLA